MKSGDMRHAQQASATVETLQRAMAAIQSQRPEEAIRLPKDVLGKNPGHPNALHIFGYAF